MKNILFYFSLLLSSTLIYAQEVIIPDSVFKDKLLNCNTCATFLDGSTGIVDKNKNRMIEVSEVESVISLFLNPKMYIPFIGYSDISAYHIAMYQKTGLITFHGPIPSGMMNGNTLEEFQKLFFQNSSVDYDFKKLTLVGDTTKYDVLETLRPGIAGGRLMGGNLTVVSSMVGMPYEPDFKDTIAFFEDIEEQPYRIDRMFTQLIHGSNLSKAKGILLGQFTNCQAKDPETSFTLVETLKDRLLPLGIPILAGTPFGHVPDNLTIPVGAEAILDASNHRLKIEKRLFK